MILRLPRSEFLIVVRGDKSLRSFTRLVTSLFIYVMKKYDKVDRDVEATDFEYSEIEEIDDPVKLVLEEYVKPRKNGRTQ